MKFTCYNKAMKVLQPSEQPLDFPAATVPLQETTILRLGPFLSIRGEHFDAPSLFQSGIKGITVEAKSMDELIDENTPVEVLRVDGYNVLVKRKEQTDIHA